MYGWEGNMILISIQTTRGHVGSSRSDCVRSVVAKVADSCGKKLDLLSSQFIKNKILSLYISNKKKYIKTKVAK